jgi:hypothetical protein
MPWESLAWNEVWTAKLANWSAPKISCIFLLTDAIVIDQEFMDANIDVVAVRTILPGEEIVVCSLDMDPKRQ